MSSMNHVTRQLEEMGLTVAADGEVIFCEDPDLNFTRSHDGVRGIARWFAEVKEEYAMAINDLLNEDKDTEFAETKAAIDEEVATWSEDEQQFQADLELAEIAREEERLANEESPDEPWTYEEAVGRPLGEIEPEEEAVTDARIEKAQDEAESYSENAPCHTQAGDHGEEIRPHFFGSPLDDPAMGKKLNEALMSPKEIWQAAQGNDQDRGSVPNPADYIRDMELGVVHSVKIEFEVSGIGYVTGEFKRRFTEKDMAQGFARACVAAAKSPRYASTIRIMTV